jgi:hypothetical protein
MPSIYPRQSTSNSLHLISQTIPSRRPTTHHQQIDARQNSGFSLRYNKIFSLNEEEIFFSNSTRPSSAETKKISGLTTTNHGSNGIRDSLVRRKYLF